MHNPAESFMDKGTFIYSERRLAEHLGIPRKNLAACRLAELEKGSHWQLIDGHVALSLRGIAQMLCRMKIDCGKVDPTACYLDNGTDHPSILLLPDGRTPPQSVRMRVRTIFPNPRLLECTEVGRPLTLARVVVPSNQNFTIGMEFEAIPDPANPAFWLVKDARLPRWRGRW
jgi:hypothetical protein